MMDCKFCGKVINDKDLHVILHYDSYIVKDDIKTKFGDVDTWICTDCAVKKGLLPNRQTLNEVIRVMNMSIAPIQKHAMISRLFNLR
jgi:hypothetical protein